MPINGAKIMKRHRQHQTQTAGEVDVSRVATYRGTWTCSCKSTNTLYANKPLVIGHALMLRVRCAFCPLVWRLRLVKTFGQT